VPLGRPYLPVQDPAGFAPPRSAVPTTITIAVVAIVAVVVAVASVTAYRADTTAAAPATVSPAAPVTAAKDSIDFTTGSGSGRLIIHSHAWEPLQAAEPSDSALQVQLELVCTGGEVDYDPFDFQAFDQHGQLFDLATDAARGPILPAGTLQAGQRVSGLVAFVLPRGDVTLLMSQDASSVTALQIPD